MHRFLKKAVTPGAVARREDRRKKKVKYCKQCGAELKDEASFCPKCGTKVQDTAGTGAGSWQNVAGQWNAPPADSRSTGGGGGTGGILNRTPEGAADRMKDLSAKALEGASAFAGKAKEYGGKLAESAGEWKEGIAEGRQERQQQKVQSPPKERKKKSRAGFVAIPLLLVAVVASAAIYWYSRFTLVGVWKLVDTEAMGVDLGSLDLTDPEDLLVKAMLTLADGTRIVFTEEGDLLATASLGGAAAGLGVMDYTDNSGDSFTIHVSVDVLVTTLSANYTCAYEFDGPDRLIIHVEDAQLVLTRDKDGDPEEYLEQVSDGALDFNFNFGF